MLIRCFIAAILAFRARHRLQGRTHGENHAHGKPGRASRHPQGGVPHRDNTSNIIQVCLREKKNGWRLTANSTKSPARCWKNSTGGRPINDITASTTVLRRSC